MQLKRVNIWAYLLEKRAGILSHFGVFVFCDIDKVRKYSMRSRSVAKRAIDESIDRRARWRRCPLFFGLRLSSFEC
jgi:hypothetical protein